eukprot:10472597-Ditylum_brightwellii.AAC.1
MEGINRSQSKPAYKETMKSIHLHIFTLWAYVAQTWYMCRNLIKPFKMSIQEFVAQVNKINKRLAQFLPRDDKTSQEKIADDKIMVILENTMPTLWQEEMHHQ